MRVVIAASSIFRCSGCSSIPFTAAGRGGRCNQFRRTFLNGFWEICRSSDFVHQAPGFGAFAFYAVGIGAEQIGEIAAHFALVHHSREATGAGQNAEQRSLRQTDSAGAIVDQDDFVAGERELVAAAGGGAVQRGEKFQAVVASWSLPCHCGFRW